jgi:2-aminoadipate transaminase
MTDTHLSRAALRAEPDAMAPLFTLLGQRVEAFKTTGSEFMASMAVGAPDNAVLPKDLYIELTKQVVENDPSMLNYKPPQGLPLLRIAMTDMLTKQGITECTPDDVLITNGGMEAISFGALMTANVGDTVLVEGPSYAGALGLFGLMGLKVIQLPMSEEGVTPDIIEAAIKQHNPTLISLMPDYQNPTGAVMPIENRKLIASLLKKYDIIALEDGAYSQLTIEGDALPPLQSFAPEHILYATSVSKIFAPGMRIGALVAPKAILDAAANTKSIINMQASAPAQAVTAAFLSSDNTHLEAHLTYLRRTYRARRDAMIAALEKYFPADTFTWTHPKGGMFLWLSGPETVNFTMLFDDALKNGVAYVPGSKFYADSIAHNSARLNFASTPEDKVEEAVRRLAITIGLL